MIIVQPYFRLQQIGKYMYSVSASEYPVIKPWFERAMSIQYVPSGYANMIDALRGLLYAIVENPLTPQLTLAGSVDKVDATGYCTRIKPLGLISKEHGNWALTECGRTWLQSEDNEYLAAVFCSNVMFMGEQLALMDEPISESDLLECAVEQYGMSWKTTNQVHVRNDWFRLLGLVQHYSYTHSYQLTDVGRRFLSKITVLTCDEVEEQRRSLLPEPSSPSQWVVDICNNSTESLDNRALSIGHIPGKAADYITTIAETLSFLNTPRTIEEFDSFTLESFGTSKDTSQGFRSTLRKLGLLNDVAEGMVVSEIGLTWLEKSSPVDFVLYLHSIRSDVMEIVCQLMEGPKRRKQLENDAYVQFGIHLDKGNLAKRIDFLKLSGYIVGTKILEATDAGKDALSLVATQGIQSQLANSGDVSQTVDVDESQASLKLRSDLRLAAHDSTKWREFEILCAQAFEKLGFAAKRIGGSGNPDVLVTAQCSKRFAFSITVDAKSSNSGTVGSNDINFDAIDKHRRKYKAEYALIIAPGFQSESTVDYAVSHKVLLLDVDSLSRLIVFHEKAPLAAQDYKALFQSSGIAEIGILDGARDKVMRNGALMHAVMECLSSQSTDEDSGGVLSAEMIRMIIRVSGSFPGPGPIPNTQEVTEMLNLLSSPMIGCIGKDKDGYYAIGSLEEAANRFGFYAKECHGEDKQGDS